jgi:hypothetical protein
VLVASGHAGPGARVQLYAWSPSADEVQPGQSVPRKLLAVTTASATGSYALHAPAASLRAAAQTSGYLNLEADAGSASRFFIWRTNRAAGQTLSAAGPARPATVNLRANPDFCGNWIFDKQFRAAWAIVGQSYITRRATHVKQRFTYHSGQSSSLGIGLSATGAAGSFSAAGTVSQSASTTSTFPTYKTGVKAWYRTKFRVAQYYEICVIGGNDSKNWLVRSNGYAGGENVRHPRSAPTAHNCAPYPRGSKFATDREKAVTWSAGLSIPVVGFNGSAQTGYDHSAQVLYTFGANRHACGTGGLPPGSSRQVVAER